MSNKALESEKNDRAPGRGETITVQPTTDSSMVPLVFFNFPRQKEGAAVDFIG